LLTGCAVIVNIVKYDRNQNIFVPVSDLAEQLGAVQPTISIIFAGLILALDRTDRYLTLDSKQ
jgi:hypothetical protein